MWYNQRVLDSKFEFPTVNTEKIFLKNLLAKLFWYLDILLSTQITWSSKSKLFWFQSLRYFLNYSDAGKCQLSPYFSFLFFFSFEYYGCNNRCTIVMLLNCFRKQEHNKFHLGANKWDSIWFWRRETEEQEDTLWGQEGGEITKTLYSKLPPKRRNGYTMRGVFPFP